jgi:hypothetical protein
VGEAAFGVVGAAEAGGGEDVGSMTGREEKKGLADDERGGGIVLKA